MTPNVLAMTNNVRDGSPRGGRNVGESFGAALLAELEGKVGVVGAKLAHKVGLTPKTLRTILKCLHSGELARERWAATTSGAG